MRKRTIWQSGGRLLAMALAGMSLTMAGRARAAVIIHTEVVELTPSEIGISGQITSPSTLFEGDTEYSNSYTVPAAVLANPYLKAVRIELVAAYEYDTSIYFIDAGRVLLDIYGSVQGVSTNGSLTFVNAGETSPPPYDDTTTVDGNLNTLETVPTMTGAFTGTSGFFETGSPEFNYLTNPEVTLKAIFDFSVWATELDLFDSSPILFGGANYNYDQSPVSRFIVTYYIPEPSSAALLSLALLGMLRRRSRRTG